MLLAVVSDVRLVLVQRSPSSCTECAPRKTSPDATKRALALETREIYAALANRLGVWQLKWELEDLAFRLLDPRYLPDIAARTQGETR